jgi:hypothetical protein
MRTSKDTCSPRHANLVLVDILCLTTHSFLAIDLNVCSSFVFLDGLLHPEPVQRCSIAQIRSCSWLNDQTFFDELAPFPLNVTHCWTSVNNDLTTTANTSDSLRTTRSSFEDEAHAKLQDLGITCESLQKTSNNGNSKGVSNGDRINGTYRIILHRLQKQSNPIECDDLSEKIINDELIASWTRSMSVHGESCQHDDPFDKPAGDLSHGNTSMKSRRQLEQTRSSRKSNGISQQHTKVCTIL